MDFLQIQPAAASAGPCQWLCHCVSPLIWRLASRHAEPINRRREQRNNSERCCHRSESREQAARSESDRLTQWGVEGANTERTVQTKLGECHMFKRSSSPLSSPSKVLTCEASCIMGHWWRTEHYKTRPTINQHVCVNVLMEDQSYCLKAGMCVMVWYGIRYGMV